jgi:hypothetical protein
MRRAIHEAKWTVTLTTVGPPAQTITKQVEAPSQDMAVRRTLQAFPGVQFTNVSAAAVDPQNTPPPQKPSHSQQQLPRQNAGVRGLQPLMMPGQQQQQQPQESVYPRRLAYPYSISLPKQFSKILHETSPVPIRESNGQHQIVLLDESQMKRFFDRLRASRDQYGSLIIDGIRSSIE